MTKSITTTTTLVYRSRWSTRKPLQYSDDSSDGAVNRFVDNLFRARTKRLVTKNNKYYYCPSEEYKQFIIKIKIKNETRYQNRSRSFR
jgi:hypothetical protein